MHETIANIAKENATLITIAIATVADTQMATTTTTTTTTTASRLETSSRVVKSSRQVEA